MGPAILPADLHQTERSIRLLAILEAAEKVALSPMGVRAVHAVAYFADALAPLWGVPIIDGQLLKKGTVYYPALQADLDRLVGYGVVTVRDVHHVEVSENSWRLEAEYALNHKFADRILSAAREYPRQVEELKFVHEVVFAFSGLGMEGLGDSSTVDITYADPMVDEGGLIDIERDGSLNPTVATTLRFTHLVPAANLSSPELINLYVRRLYSLIRVA
jgi:hypothetical protein